MAKGKDVRVTIILNVPVVFEMILRKNHWNFQIYYSKESA
uniref:Uncharacterized protein n=1 Tax=Brassica oleracea TaxID=3712 RepID=A0A3P6HIM4_BRAOL|nr:unnamed protein product [Brassica oleracea]